MSSASVGLASLCSCSFSCRKKKGFPHRPQDLYRMQGQPQFFYQRSRSQWSFLRFFTRNYNKLRQLLICATAICMCSLPSHFSFFPFFYFLSLNGVVTCFSPPSPQPPLQTGLPSWHHLMFQFFPGTLKKTQLPWFLPPRESTCQKYT